MCLPNVSGGTPSPIAHSSRVNLATFSAPSQYASIADLRVPTCLSDHLDNATTPQSRIGGGEREREREAVISDDQAIHTLCHQELHNILTFYHQRLQLPIANYYFPTI